MVMDYLTTSLQDPYFEIYIHQVIHKLLQHLLDHNIQLLHQIWGLLFLLIFGFKNQLLLCFKGDKWSKTFQKLFYILFFCLAVNILNVNPTLFCHSFIKFFLIYKIKYRQNYKQNILKSRSLVGDFFPFLSLRQGTSEDINTINPQSSPPFSSLGKLIPDEEVVSQFISDDNNSHFSGKVVRFLEPKLDSKSETNSSGYQRISLKYRKQCSIPNTVVNEDINGEVSRLSHVGDQFRIKDDLGQMNQSTNLLNEEFHNLSFFSSSYQRNLSNSDLDKINQFAEELVAIVKDYLSNLSFNDGNNHFHFNDEPTPTVNKLLLQQRVLKRALENLSFKLSVPIQSPISKPTTQYSPHFDENIGNIRDLEFKLAEYEDTIECMKDKQEILEVNDFLQLKKKFKYFQMYTQVQQKDTQIQQQLDEISELNKKLKTLQLELDSANQKINTAKLESENTSKINQQLKNLMKSEAQPIQRQKRSQASLYESVQSIPAPARNVSSSFHSPVMQSRAGIINEDGTIYHGNLVDGMKQGYGILKNTNNQDIYIGFWSKDQYHGCGQLKNLQIQKRNFDISNLNLIGDSWISYQGEFKQGLYNGYGIITFYNQHKFHGQFKNGKANGKGTYYGLKTISGIWENNIKV